MRLGGRTNHIANRTGETIDVTLQNYADGIAKEMRGPALRDRVIVEELGPTVTAIVTGHPKLKNKDQVSAFVTLGLLHYGAYAYLEGSDAMSGRVSISYWSGLRGLPVEDRIRQMYLAGEAPSRHDMLELMITWALQGSSFANGEPSYDPTKEYCSLPSMANEFAKRAVQLMLDDEENGAYEIAHAAVGQNSDKEARLLLKGYYIKAGKIIAKELEANT